MSLFQISEELVIDLTLSEKSTFFRFLFLYLVSSFVFMTLVAFLYFQNEKTLYFDLTKSNMQNIVSKVSNEIIISHMKDIKFDKESYLNNEYKISFYDNKRVKLFGNFDEKINFTKKVISSDEFIILVDNSTVGHLGIEYIVIKDSSISQKLNSLKTNITILLILSFIFVAIVGIYLAKLFLKPIKDERDRLNTFIKDTTHELNTPISAILMSTEEETLNEKQIQRVRLSAKRVSEIYADLTYIFLQKDTQKTNIKKILLKKIIEEQLKYFEPLAIKKKIKIDLDIDDIYYEIIEDDFIRVFNNLVSNAIKYNKIGGKIEIKLSKTSLIIKDTGIGIKESEIKDIFKRYFRATSTQGGFGIGLSIVNEICKKYSIKIDIQSKKELGTSFILTF